MSSIPLAQFQANQSASEANRAMKLAVNTLTQARHCAVVWFAEIVTRKLYRDLGYSSIYQYAEMELEFSSTRTGDFLRLAKKLEELPQLKQDLEQGKVGYTKAREIIKVANSQNEMQWLKEARHSTRDTLAKTVRKAKEEAKSQARVNRNQGSLLDQTQSILPPAALKHRISFEMTTEQYARYEALCEKLYKSGGFAGGCEKAEMILAGLGSLLKESAQERNASSSLPVQIHVHKCPDCEKAAITTNRGEIPLAPEEVDRLECDAQIDQPDRPNKSTIPPSVRRKILSRDRHLCQIEGCRNTLFLEIHHIKPRTCGGTNDLKNLITLCGGCHRLLHERGLHKYPDYPLKFKRLRE